MAWLFNSMAWWLRSLVAAHFSAAAAAASVAILFWLTSALYPASAAPRPPPTSAPMPVPTPGITLPMVPPSTAPPPMVCKAPSTPLVVLVPAFCCMVVPLSSRLPPSRALCPLPKPPPAAPPPAAAAVFMALILPVMPPTMPPMVRHARNPTSTAWSSPGTSASEPARPPMALMMGKVISPHCWKPLMISRSAGHTSRNISPQRFKSSRPSRKNAVSLAWPLALLVRSLMALVARSSQPRNPPSPDRLPSRAPAALVSPVMVLKTLSTALPKARIPFRPSSIHRNRLPFAAFLLMNLSSRSLTLVIASPRRGRKSLPVALSWPSAWVSGSMALVARFWPSAVLPKMRSMKPSVVSLLPTRMASLKVLFQAPAIFCAPGLTRGSTLPAKSSSCWSMPSNIG